MPQRRLAQLVTELLLVGHEAIHEIPETLVVTALQQMRHLVDDDVLQATGRLLNQLQKASMLPHSTSQLF